jgi:hypothetical protein
MDDVRPLPPVGTLIAFDFQAMLLVDPRPRIGLVVRVCEDNSLDIFSNANDLSETWYILNYEWVEITNLRPIPPEEAQHYMNILEQEANGVIQAITTALTTMRKQRFRLV